MRVHFKNHAGYDLWADIEDVTMLIKLDGTVVTSVADAYCSERLLTPEETEWANNLRTGWDAFARIQSS